MGYSERVEPLKVPASTRALPLSLRSEHSLEIRAMERQGRFGSLETSWLVKNCFATWRSLIHVKANFVLARDNEITIATNELDVIRELQIALAEKDELILDLEDKIQGTTRDLIACENRSRTDVAEFENRLVLQVNDFQDERVRFEEHHANRLAEMEERLRLMEEDRDRRLREAENKASRVDEEWRRRLRDAEDLSESLQEEHRLHIGRLEDAHSQRLRESHGGRSRLEEGFESRLRDAQAGHERMVAELEERLRDAADRQRSLEDQHLRDTGRLQDENSVAISRLHEKQSQLSSRLEEQRKELETHCAARLREAEEQSAQLDSDWRRRLREAEDDAARAKDQWSRKLRDVQDAHGLHISRIEEERGIVIQSAEDTRRALEEEWGVRVRSAEQDRDHTLRQVQEQQEATIKSVCSQAAMALIGGKGKGMLAVCFHNWARATQQGLLEAEYGAKLHAAEVHRSQLEGEWNERFMSMEAERSGLERNFDMKLQTDEDERQKLLFAIEENQRKEQAMRMAKAAAALMGGTTRGIMQTAFAGWIRAFENSISERELEARLREVDDHKAHLVRQHDAELRRLEQTQGNMQAQHDAEVRRLAEEESAKMRDIELEFTQLQDTLDINIRNHEAEKMALLTSHDNERDRLLKAGKAMSLLISNKLVGSANTIAQQHQDRLLLLETFVAWSQHQTHTKWTKTVDDFYRATGEEADRLCSRRENAAELLALRGISRMALYEAFTQWQQLAVASRLGVSAEEAKRELAKQNRLERTRQALFLITKDQGRMMLSQVFSAWLRTATLDAELGRHRAEEAKRRAVESQRGKAFGLRWALQQMDSSCKFLGQKILSAWFLFTRESKWGARIDKAEALRRSNGQRQRASALRVGESLAQARGAHYAFYAWSRTTASGLKSREATDLSHEIALMRMKHDNVSSIFINLHFKAFINAVLHEWWEYAHKLSWARLLDQASREVSAIRGSRLAVNNRLIMKVWGSNLTILVQTVFNAWRQGFLDRGTDKGVGLLQNTIASLKSRAANVFRQRPLALMVRFLASWRHIVLERRGAQGQWRLKQASWSLTQEMEDNQIFRISFLLQGVFTRWKHWTGNIKHQRSLEALREALLEQSYSGGRGRVLAVVSAIEDQRLQLAAWEAFTRWALLVRMERQPQTQALPVTTYYMYPPTTMPVQQPPRVLQTVLHNAQTAVPRAVPVMSFPGTQQMVNLPGTQQRIATGTQAPLGTVISMGLPTATMSVDVNMGLPTATIGVDTDHNGHPNFMYTGVDLDHNGIPDALEVTQQGMPIVGTVTVENIGLARTLDQVICSCGNDIGDDPAFCRKCGTTRLDTSVRRPSVRRRQMVPVHSLVPSHMASCAPAMATSSSTPTLGFAYPINGGITPVSSTGTLWEAEAQPLPTISVSPRRAREPASSSGAPPFASVAAGYGLRMHTAPSSAAWPGAAIIEVPTSSVEMGASTPTRASASRSPIWAPPSPRQAFSEVIPPPSFATAPAGAASAAVAGSGGSIRASPLSPCAGSGGVLRTSSLSPRQPRSGPPVSLTSSVQSQLVQPPVSPAPAQRPVSPAPHSVHRAVSPAPQAAPTRGSSAAHFAWAG